KDLFILPTIARNVFYMHPANHSTPVNQDVGALTGEGFAQQAPGATQFALEVAEQRRAQLVLRGELSERGNGIHAYRQHGYALVGEDIEVFAERAHLGGACARECQREERYENGAGVAEGRQGNV